MTAQRAQKAAVVAKEAQSQRLLPSGCTMLVVRNVPCTETIGDLMKVWPAEGRWNYLYFPYSVTKNHSMGYLFINFIDHKRAAEFADRWHQRSLPGRCYHRALTVSAATVQSVSSSLTRIKWELLLQLAEIGMEPVLLVQGQRVDARFVHLVLSQSRSGCLLGARTPLDLTSEPASISTVDEADDCAVVGVSEGEVPWPSHLMVLSL
mmetsp:Transcript_84673/g.196873  ORF Transcript_84673/g.196873 Transcript_84673/m.196873 type:complete len:207 (-) Transcript_84673:442-1062(-)